MTRGRRMSRAKPSIPLTFDVSLKAVFEASTARIYKDTTLLDVGDWK